MPTKRKEWWACQYKRGGLSLNILGQPRLFRSKYAAKKWITEADKCKPVRVRLEVIDAKDKGE